MEYRLCVEKTNPYALINNMKKRIIHCLLMIVVLLLIIGGLLFYLLGYGCIQYVGGVVGIRYDCKSAKQCWRYLLSPFERDMCYFSVATNNKDIKVCERIRANWSKEGCRSNINEQLLK